MTLIIYLIVIIFGLVSCDNHEAIFEKNCKKVNVVMTMQQDIKTMNEELNVNHNTYPPILQAK